MSVGGVVSLVPGQASPVADRLVVCGTDLAKAAGGADRAIPGVPEDVHGLARLFVELDEAREAFDRKVGDVVFTAAGHLALIVLEAQSADDLVFPPLPKAGR